MTIDLLDSQPPSSVPGLACPVCGSVGLSPCRLEHHVEPRAFAEYVRRHLVLDYINDSRHTAACARRTR